MNNNPRARAILATCILLALLAPGFALARRQPASPSPAAPSPENWLPIILNERQPTSILPATATGTATATATPTGTQTTTATATSTSTPTNTATATIPLNTPSATTKPTVDAQATTSLEITNGTGFVLTYSLEGPTFGDGVLRATQSIIIPIATGHYTVTGRTQCTSAPFDNDYTVPNVIYQITFVCQ
jgi:hypothetical protein